MKPGESELALDSVSNRSGIDVENGVHKEEVEEGELVTMEQLVLYRYIYIFKKKPCSVLFCLLLLLFHNMQVAFKMLLCW